MSAAHAFAEHAGTCSSGWPFAVIMAAFFALCGWAFWLVSR